jgi:hypothetical protein
MMSRLDQTVWTIHTGAVVQCTYNDLRDHIRTATRPDGIGYEYYVKPFGDGTFGLFRHLGAGEKLVREYNNEDDAVSEAERIWIMDIDASGEIAVFHRAADAARALAECAE